MPNRRARTADGAAGNGLIRVEFAVRSREFLEVLSYNARRLSVSALNRVEKTCDAETTPFPVGQRTYHISNDVGRSSANWWPLGGRRLPGFQRSRRPCLSLPNRLSARYTPLAAETLSHCKRRGSQMQRRCLRKYETVTSSLAPKWTFRPGPSGPRRDDLSGGNQTDDRQLTPFAAKASFALDDDENLMKLSAVSRCKAFVISTAVYVRYFCKRRAMDRAALFRASSR
jgi:hypothetical protein